MSVEMPEFGCGESPSSGLFCWMRPTIVATLAALLVAAGAAGCAGGGGSSPVVLHVAGVAIDRATVDHWTKAIALGSPVAGALGRSSSTPREKALNFLISSHWAIGAAAERGLGVSAEAVARGLKEKIETVPNGSAEFEREIAATGQTIADVKLEIKAALALARLREFLSARVPPVTEAQIADYYRHHLRRFYIPDRRLVDLVEEIHGYAHAVAIGKQLGSGARFTRRAIRELVTRQTPYEAAHRENGQLVHAIFTAAPGRLAGPVIYHHKWVILVVRKLVPHRTRSLGEVHAKIAEQLTDERRHRALMSFLEAYRREWAAKTSCTAALVVQKCSEYRGPLAPEGNLLAGD